MAAIYVLQQQVGQLMARVDALETEVRELRSQAAKPARSTRKQRAQESSALDEFDDAARTDSSGISKSEDGSA